MVLFGPVVVRLAYHPLGRFSTISRRYDERSFPVFPNVNMKSVSTPTSASRGPVSVISPLTTFGTTMERFCSITGEYTADDVWTPPRVGVVVIGIFTVPAKGSWPVRLWIPSEAGKDSPSVSPVASPGVIVAFHRSASLNPPDVSASKVMSPTVMLASIVSDRSETRL